MCEPARKKTIAVLTSGGDAPGMNAAIRAVVRGALSKDLRVLGIRRGFQGLLNKDVIEMNRCSVSNCLFNGGTILYTSRCAEFNSPEGVERGRQACEELGIDGLVVIGGDGSFRGARDLSLAGVPCVGIPGTIDNDVSCTDYTIGFDTALNTVSDMVERLRDTAQSHDCCTVVEVMGRHCGDIALHAGLACGAIAILVPEMPFSIEEILSKIKRTLLEGKKHFIIMVAEGIIKDGRLESVQALADEVGARTGIKSRSMVLGFAQRGGEPSAHERVLAGQMGFYAVELLEQGIGNRVIAVKKEEIVDLDILEALSVKRAFNERMYRIADAISI